MDDVTITINIADRPYRLKIKKEEEEVIMMAVKEIEMRLKDYSEQFAFQDKQDLMAMALLHFSATALKMENGQPDMDESALSKLRSLDQMLTDLLV
jgi:cell division protein ZapA